MGKQGETATNKDNNINIIKGLIYSGIPSNMAGYCKLMAQNWHKNSYLLAEHWKFMYRWVDPIRSHHTPFEKLLTTGRNIYLSGGNFFSG